MRMTFWGTHFRSCGRSEDGKEQFSGDAFFRFDSDRSASHAEGPQDMLIVEFADAGFFEAEIALWAEQLILEYTGARSLAALEQERDFNALELLSDIVKEIISNKKVEVDWTGNNPALLILD